MKIKCPRLKRSPGSLLPWTWRREEFEKSMRDLKYIFATRQTLRKNGLNVISRRFFTSRQKKAEQFLQMAQVYPSFYGEIGSTSWIQGFLVHLNEPGVVTWNDVEEWLKDPMLMKFVKAVPKDNCEVNELPVSHRYQGYKDNVVKLKTGFVKLVRCDDKVSSAPSPPLATDFPEVAEEAQDNAHDKVIYEESPGSTPTTIVPESDEEDDIVFLEEFPRARRPTVATCTKSVSASSSIVFMPVTTSSPAMNPNPGPSSLAPVVPMPVAVTPAPVQFPNVASVSIPADVPVLAPISTPPPSITQNLASVPASVANNVPIILPTVAPAPVSERVHSCGKCVETVKTLQGMLIFVMNVELEMVQRIANRQPVADLVQCIESTKQRLLHMLRCNFA